MFRLVFTASSAPSLPRHSMMVTPPGATTPVADRGKYLEVWRKQADGSWKLIRDMFSSDLPLPPPAPVPMPAK